MPLIGATEAGSEGEESSLYLVDGETGTGNGREGSAAPPGPGTAVGIEMCESGSPGAG